MNGPAIKCGYCGFILRGSCGTILDHHCFSAYDENTEAINVDENAVATIRKRHETENIPHTKERDVQSALTQDELLIELVRTRRPLWDHSIPLKDRTKLIKDNLWQEIVNIFDGSLSMEEAKQKWKNLRDQYTKARKKMRGYVRSGSGAESGHPLRSSFAHYEEMKFLDDTLQTAPTVSSIQPLLEVNSSHLDDNDMQRNDMADADYFTCDDSTMDVASTSNASSRKSCSPSEARKKKAKIAQRQADMETKFLNIIDETSRKKRDVVDSYLDQLGDILRRLPYLRRRNLQRRMMDIAIQEEDMELAERENP
ncbi:uncharacterized protein LOC143899515 [Temnothorax americanus]|uniref:uncharacterized protein LOC143899515 n=1 Tax=Temnothorax americanus TaxID=1964332 RepID=UPI004067CDCB